MKRMLINATQPEELRVAIVDGQHLHDLDIEVPSKAQKKANIYKGKITRIEPSLEAAFVEFGSERHGFLPFKEVARQYYKNGAAQEGGRANIRDAINEGQELIVQVEKEERGNKGAALTTFVSLAGRYLVLMPNNPRAGGISRRVEGEERADLREALSALDIPTGMGLIVRTAGVGRQAEELQWDLDYLLKVWSAVEAASDRKAPFLIYQESNLIVRAIRDYFSSDLNEVLIDDEQVYGEARDFVQQVMPHNLSKLKRYDDGVPLFSRYQIESRIESAFQHSVRLPSGGSIVIDHTEALVAVDINSARATKGSDIEETALNTNLEAADEVARQLRLRDLGGLIVIDFIDMTPSKNQREVENRLREALKHDRARVQIGRISRFGLLEMSRQRLRPSLGESHLLVCSKCSGQGVIRSTESLALSILRLVEEEAMKEKTGKVVIRMPLEVGTFLLNEKREALVDVEARHGVGVIIVPDASFETPHYELQRIRSDDAEHEVNSKSSYELAEVETELPEFATQTVPTPEPEPAVKRITPPPVREMPAPTEPAPSASGPGLIKRLMTTLFGASSEVSPPPAAESATPATESTGGGNGRRRNNSRRRGGSNRSSNNGGNEQNREDRPKQESKDTNRRTEAARPEGARSDGGRADSGRRGGRDANKRNSAEGATSQETEVKVTKEAQEGQENQENQEGDAKRESTAGRSRSGSRRGRRGGRGRRGRSSEGTEASTTEGENGSSSGEVDAQNNGNVAPSSHDTSPSVPSSEGAAAAAPTEAAPTEAAPAAAVVTPTEAATAATGSESTPVKSDEAPASMTARSNRSGRPTRGVQRNLGGGRPEAGDSAKGGNTPVAPSTASADTSRAESESSAHVEQKAPEEGTAPKTPVEPPGSEVASKDLLAKVETPSPAPEPTPTASEPVASLPPAALPTTAAPAAREAPTTRADTSAPQHSTPPASLPQATPDAGNAAKSEGNPAAGETTVQPAVTAAPSAATAVPTTAPPSVESAAPQTAATSAPSTETTAVQQPAAADDATKPTVESEKT
jgi:ribonuclease E